jgi:putative toxin-antitoxin system antitoxin component (TIGR02293 family)
MEKKSIFMDMEEQFYQDLVKSGSQDLPRLELHGHQLKYIQEKTGLKVQDFSKIIGMGKSRFYNLVKESSNLTLEEKDALSVFIKLWEKGISVFDDSEEHFNEFLHTRNPSLGNVYPIELLSSQTGRIELDKVLNRIEYGVFG